MTDDTIDTRRRDTLALLGLGGLAVHVLHDAFRKAINEPPAAASAAAPRMSWPVWARAWRWPDASWKSWNRSARKSSPPNPTPSAASRCTAAISATRRRYATPWPRCWRRTAASTASSTTPVASSRRRCAISA
ncbi:protein of unknown function [Cupriavidus taiwanensis]|uniref:Uncharacterized protein n=1 Tax=Cupriavidus taiwanensis TaxID=164546 RepID=A0A9Q7UU27_9BURK|nr:protein of unknown function [Cupriavidus taiwanensis]